MNNPTMTLAGAGGAWDSDKKPTLPSFDKINKNVIITALEDEFDGFKHGIITVEMHVREGKIARYVIKRERSVLAGGGSR